MLRIAAFVLALALVLFATMAVLVDSEAVIRRVADAALPRASTILGREVQLESVRLSLVPSPTVVVRDLTVEGEAPERPLLSAGLARGRLAWWPLLRSLGRQVEVTTVELENVTVNAERRTDGTWSHDPVVARLETFLSTPRTREYAVDAFKLRDGRVRVLDAAAAGGRGQLALSGIEITATGLTPGRPARVEWRAALQGARHNVSGELHVEPLPAIHAGLAPGRWPKVRGRFALDGLRLDSLDGLLPPALEGMVSAGRVRFDSRLRTAADGRYELHGAGDLEDLELRGGPARGHFAVDASMEPGKLDSLELRVHDAAVNGPGIVLGGSASVRPNPLRVTLDATGPLLDLDLLARPTPPLGEADTPTPGGTLLSAEARGMLRQASIEGTIRIGKITRGKLVATDLRARVRLRHGQLRFREARAQFFGGGLDAAGTTIELDEPEPRWNLGARLETVDVGQALQEISGTTPLRGAATGWLSLRGQGVDWNRLRRQLDGVGRLRLANAALPAADLSGQLTKAVRAGVAGLAGPGLAGDAELGEANPEQVPQEFEAWFQVHDGWLSFQRPFALDVAPGRLELSGRVGLDQRLALTGTVQLDPTFVERLTRGRLHPDAPVPVPVRIGGTLDEPRLESLDAGALARGLVSSAGPRVRERLEGMARDRLEGFFRGL